MTTTPPLVIFSDYGYKKRYPWSQLCIRDPDATDVDPHRIPDPCPEDTYYTRSKGSVLTSDYNIEHQIPVQRIPTTPGAKGQYSQVIIT